MFRSIFAVVLVVIALPVFAQSPSGKVQPAASASSPKENTQPPTPPPSETPPPPPAGQPPAEPHTQPIESRPAPAPAANLPPPAAQSAPSGQWVYTTQYGWLWMAYDPPYTYVVPGSSVAYNFVYYPGFGWRWVVAPWVFGLGPMPIWGALGPVRFQWYVHPFHVGVPFRGTGWRAGGFGGGWRGHGRR